MKCTRETGFSPWVIREGSIRAGLVDEWQLFVTPIIVGGGLGWLPDGVRVGLELVEERRFAGGTTYLRYRTDRSAGR